ncbi:MAG TPA: D-alanyl-D-alanine carboxypeptidase/D-alanyl-D-alanine-endopeptidase [Ilumatobacteraceae bacterium]|nr:D-alanyl-D-alanine carboxypeptidase/D-alanyl-D-alanine-endopeptidase [Ilumatobacteraceae bacterium]
MRVDVVAAPVRYRLAPLFALVAVLLVPLVGLSALLVWSDGQADEHEAARDSGDVPAAPVPPPDAAAPALATPLLTYRRAPERVATAGDDARLAEAMEELAFFVDDRSCLAVSVDGRPVTAHNADVAVIPASTVKLVVAAVALDQLGADHVFTTNVVGPPVVDGEIDGDVYLVGGGDPLLVADDYPIEDDLRPEFNTTSLDALADAVAATGVQRIRGAVIGDGSRYDDEFVVPSWGPGVAFVEAGPYDALVVNDSRTLGRFGRQPDPNLAAAREFVRLLDNRGIQVDRGVDTGPADPALGALASIQSQPLGDVLAEMLTNSDNDTAEMLVKELGVADGGVGTLPAGLDVIDRTLRSWGVPMAGVRLTDGSGLSSDNRLTCAALLAVLQRVAAGPVAAGLPVAGRTGTLSDEFVGTAVDGRLAAKTGTLGNPPVELDPPAVKALAGLIGTTGGDTIEFVLVLNGPDISEPDNYDDYWSALADRLAAYPQGPDPATIAPE